MKEIERNNKSFEDIKHIDENGAEFWYARELQAILDYKEWRKFNGTIEKAKKSCENSNVNILDHFVETDKMVTIGSGAQRKQLDYKLSRYACYLIAQNGDSRKEVIALAQTYFAIQTRKQEITEKEANQTHYDIGRIVRNAIKEAGRNHARRFTHSRKKLKTA